MKNTERYSALCVLLAPLDPYLSINYAASENESFEVLNTFITELKRIGPNPITFISHPSGAYYGHLLRLMMFKKALQERRYSDACRNLYELATDADVLQKRVYCAVIKAWDEKTEETK